MLKQLVRNRTASKYGDKLFEDLAEIKTAKGKNLSTIARDYGISRERARQLFKEVYGEGFSKYQAEKTVKRKEEKRQEFLDPEKREKRMSKNWKVGAEGKAWVYREFKNRGFKVQVTDSRGRYDFKVNDLKVSVYSAAPSNETKSLNKKMYYHFHISGNKQQHSDVVILCVTNKEVYIIPAKEAVSQHIYTRNEEVNHLKCRERSKYRQYKDNWQIFYRQEYPNVIRRVPYETAKLNSVPREFL